MSSPPASSSAKLWAPAASSAGMREGDAGQAGRARRGGQRGDPLGPVDDQGAGGGIEGRRRGDPQQGLARDRLDVLEILELKGSVGHCAAILRGR